MRGRSYSPPPRGYGRRGRSPSSSGTFGGRDRDLPTRLLVHNLTYHYRPEDLRQPFGQFGPLKDIYLPRNYNTGEPRGFGFVKYEDPDDAVEAKHLMDGQVLLGQKLNVFFSEENRKKLADMRARKRWRRSSPHYSRSPPAYKRRLYSRSSSTHERSYNRGRSYMCSTAFDGSRSRSRRPARTPSRRPARSRSRSPIRGRSRSPICGRSFSPNQDYSRQRKGRSPSR